MWYLPFLTHFLGRYSSSRNNLDNNEPSKLLSIAEEKYAGIWNIYKSQDDKGTRIWIKNGISKEPINLSNLYRTNANSNPKRKIILFSTCFDVHE